MTNAERILLALDAKLAKRVDLTLYGRAALQLGFVPPPEDAALSRDVDAVLRMGQAEEMNENTNFWDAAEAVNRELAGDDLYISHFFVEDQVILTPEWFSQRVSIPGSWKRMDLFRLGNADLLLSKLMRNDPIDCRDALFIARTAGFSVADVQTLAQRARVPQSSELQSEFVEAVACLCRALRAE